VQGREGPSVPKVGLQQPAESKTGGKMDRSLAVPPCGGFPDSSLQWGNPQEGHQHEQHAKAESAQGDGSQQIGPKAMASRGPGAAPSLQCLLPRSEL